MNLKLIVSGPNITVHANNGDKQGYNPDSNNEILIENAENITVEVEPASTDRITAVVTQTTE